MPQHELSGTSDTDRKLRLLIVDDDPADRALIKAMILLAQYDVLEAATGEEGIALAKEVKLDCAIVDQTLPDMIGTELFEGLRESTRDAHLPIILFTGQGDELLAVEAMHGGAADYLPKKTLSPIALGTALTNALTQARLRRELAEERLRIIAMNQKLIQANAELCSFYETVAKQLNTPLATIRELTSITLQGKGGPVTKEQQEYLSASLKSCDRLSDMIDSLVDTARVETDQLSYELQHTDITYTIKDSIELIKPAVAEAGLDLQLELQTNLPPVKADTSRLAQLLTNLMSNAIKFTDSPGLITLRTQVGADNTVSLSVSDTGRGISPDFIDKIFERFAQTRIEDSEFLQGMGTGLFMCADIAKHHNGEITVQSEPGKGSTFTLTLPVAPAREVPASNTAA